LRSAKEKLKVLMPGDDPVSSLEAITKEKDVNLGSVEQSFTAAICVEDIIQQTNILYKIGDTSNAENPTHVPRVRNRLMEFFGALAKKQSGTFGGRYDHNMICATLTEHARKKDKDWWQGVKTNQFSWKDLKLDLKARYQASLQPSAFMVKYVTPIAVKLSKIPDGSAVLLLSIADTSSKPFRILFLATETKLRKSLGLNTNALYEGWDAVKAKTQFYMGAIAAAGVNFFLPLDENLMPQYTGSRLEWVVNQLPQARRR